MSEALIPQNPFGLSTISPQAEILIKTNAASGRSIIGVAEADIRDTRKSELRKAFIVIYKTEMGTDKVEINKDLYEALKFIFDAMPKQQEISSYLLDFNSFT